jgi:hypothetical protein
MESLMKKKHFTHIVCKWQDDWATGSINVSRVVMPFICDHDENQAHAIAS